VNRTIIWFFKTFAGISFLLTVFLPFRSAQAVEVGVVLSAPEILEDLKGCEGVTLRFLSIPQTESPGLWEGGLSQAQRAYTLLEIEKARDLLSPVLSEMRTRTYWGELRLKAELLASEIASLLGDSSGRGEAVHNLALLHLYREPDPALIPPELKAEILRERERLFARGTSTVEILPPPQGIKLNGYSLELTNVIPYPPDPDLFWELTYPQVVVRRRGSPPSDRWEPLLDPEFLARGFPQGIPPYLLSAGARGTGIYRYPDRTPVEPGPQGVCSALLETPVSTLPPSPPPQPPLYQRPWFLITVGGVAVLGGVGLYLLIQGQNKPTTGSIVITW
jgi:hypothetical protein